MKGLVYKSHGLTWLTSRKKERERERELKTKTSCLARLGLKARE